MLSGKSQIDKIIDEKNSAFKVLIATKNKLLASCKKAEKFVDSNKNDINKKEEEIREKLNMNIALESQVKHMQASVKETNRIINPNAEVEEEATEAPKEEDSGRVAADHTAVS